jgi:cathepsin L
MAQTTTDADPVQAEFYKSRLEQASEPVKSLLDRLGREAAEKKWTFSVGYTTALDIPLETLAGAKPPENLLPLARRQNEFAAEALNLAPPIPNPACRPDMPRFNWRDLGKISPVRFQGECGSCWAFAAAGAFELSYNIVNTVQIDTSEQHVLDCSPGGSCAGGWYHPVFNWMIANGVTDETMMPYHAGKGSCRRPNPSAMRSRYRAAAWGYVSDRTQIPTVAELKAAICAHGGVAVALRATPAFHAYTGGVFNETDNGPINHAVVLVGWDDDRQAWLLKNSWKPTWGIHGYMWIAYGSNSVGYAAAWVRAAPQATETSPALLALARKYEIAPE